MQKQVEKTYDIPLHDIKNIVEVQEYSLYYFIGVVATSLIVLSALSFLVYKYIQKRNAYNERKEHYKILQNIDFSDTKKAAYAVSLYGATFKDDGERQAGMYENISQHLEQYKYKKNVASFDKETLSFIELYVGMLDV